MSGPLVSADPGSRSVYAAQVLERATAIVAAVHDEGPDAVRDAIARALAHEAPAGVDPVEALVTILAAAIPADAPMSELLSWVRPLRPIPSSGTCTDVDASLVADVHLLMTGRATAEQVSRSARREAVRQLTAQDFTVTEIAARLAMSERAVFRFRSASARRTREAC